MFGLGGFRWVLWEGTGVDVVNPLTPTNLLYFCSPFEPRPGNILDSFKPHAHQEFPVVPLSYIFGSPLPGSWFIVTSLWWAHPHYIQLQICPEMAPTCPALSQILLYLPVDRFWWFSAVVISGFSAFLWPIHPISPIKSLLLFSAFHVGS